MIFTWQAANRAEKLPKNSALVGAALAIMLGAARCGSREAGAIPVVKSVFESPTPTTPQPAPGSGDFSLRWFRSPLSVEDAEEILIRTRFFAIGMMGRKRQVQAYNTVLDQPDARHRFEAIAVQAGAPGKLYAWCGLTALKADSADRLEREIGTVSGVVPVMDSDVQDWKSPAALIELAKSRTLWAQMRSQKAEVAAAFQNQLPQVLQDAASGYMAALDEMPGQAAQIEAAMDALGRLRGLLMKPSSRGTVLELLTEPEFAELNGILPGVIVYRQEVVGLVPDVDYFVRLAASSGDDVDRAFFAALKVTRPHSTWPDYNERQTDYSGCIRFGTLRLVDVYRAWSDVTKKYPGRYAAMAKEELDAVANEFTDGTCACRDQASIERELDAFLAAFPASPIRAKVDQRLRDLRAGHANFRLNCKSG